jgi:GT2 family glycosyltransferase
MLSILIVNWNTRDYLRACLFSLRQTCADVEHEIIVADNASRDGSADMVRAEFPEAVLFANADNRGYAAGNNQAYEKARGETVWLLNPDTRVLDGAPQRLLDFLNYYCGANGRRCARWTGRRVCRAPLPGRTPTRS